MTRVILSCIFFSMCSAIGEQFANETAFPISVVDKSESPCGVDVIYAFLKTQKKVAQIADISSRVGGGRRNSNFGEIRDEIERHGFFVYGVKGKEWKMPPVALGGIGYIEGSCSTKWGHFFLFSKTSNDGTIAIFDPPSRVATIDLQDIHKSIHFDGQCLLIFPSRFYLLLGVAYILWTQLAIALAFLLFVSLVSLYGKRTKRKAIMYLAHSIAFLSFGSLLYHDWALSKGEGDGLSAQTHCIYGLSFPEGLKISLGHGAPFEEREFVIPVANCTDEDIDVEWIRSLCSCVYDLQADRWRIGYSETSLLRGKFKYPAKGIGQGKILIHLQNEGLAGKERVIALTVSGASHDGYSFEKTRIDFGRVSASDNRCHSLRFVCFDPSFQIAGVKSSKKWLHVSYSETQIDGFNAGEKCYLVEASMGEFPGAGYFQESIQITTNDDRHPTITIPVFGFAE